MGRNKDRFWEYAKKLHGRFECNFCGEDFAGGISRIKSHLSGVKGRDIDICMDVPPHVRAEAQQAIGSSSTKKGKDIKHSDNEILIVGDESNEKEGSKKKQSLAKRVSREKLSERVKILQDLIPGGNKVTGIAVVLEETINYVQSIQRQVEFLSMKLETVNARDRFWENAKELDENVFVGAADPAISNYEIDPSSAVLTCRESKKKAVDEKFLNFQIANGFFMEYSQTFVEFVKAVSEYGPNYELPNWYTDPDKALADEEDEILRYEVGVKESWTETGCTLMITHGKDSSDVASEVGLYLDPLHEPTYEVRIFACCPKGTLFLTSGANDEIHDHLCRIIEGIGAHHIVQVIEADGAFGSEVINPITKHHTRVLSTRSPTVEFGLIVSDVTERRSNLLLAARMIFIYVRKFSMEFARKLFDKYMEYNILVRLPVNASIQAIDDLALLLSIMELEPEVKRVVQSLDTSSYSQDLAKWVADVTVDAMFWSLGKQLVHILDVVFQVVCLGNNSRAPGFGYLYEAVNKVCKAIDEWCRKDPTRCDEIEKDCQKRLQSLIKPLHAAASFLNPAIFMCSEIFEVDSLVMEGIDYIAHNFIVEEIDRVAFLDQVEMYREKVPSIFSASASENLKAYHPCVWWHRFGGSVPVLQKYAIQILIQPCGVPLDILHTKHRISDSKWMKLLMMKRFSGSEPSSLEPIDLDKFTRVCEYVEPKKITDLSDPRQVTFEIFYSGEDPLVFWSEKKHQLKKFWNYQFLLVPWIEPDVTSSFL